MDYHIILRSILNSDDQSLKKIVYEDTNMFKSEILESIFYKWILH